MSREAFTAEVKSVIAAIIAASNGTLTDMPNVNYSLSACECAAEITGADETLCKMFNQKFRADAAQFAYERAMATLERG